MAHRRTFEGDGAILFRDSEIPTHYRIVVEKTSDLISASGTADVEPRHFIELFEALELVKLRLSSGDIVEIAFLGGDIYSPAKIAVNSKMPGF